MRRAFISTFLILVLLFVYSLGTLHAPAQQKMYHGREILDDRSLFDQATADSFDPKLQTVQWDKLRQSLPKDRPVKLNTIKLKYGDADEIVIEKAPKLAPDIDVEAYLQRSERPPISWVDAAVHYYGDIGFGVEENDSENPIMFVTNRARAVDFEPAQTPQEPQGESVAAGNYDGNWQDSVGALNMVFTVVDNAVTHASLLNLRTNVCDDTGAIFAPYSPPVPIEGNTLKIDIDGSSGSNIWLTTVTGTFNSDTTVSGRQSVLIIGQCGLTSGSADFSISKQPDYFLFATPSIRNMVVGETTTYSVGMRTFGSFNQPVQVELIAPAITGVAFSLSSNSIQPNGSVTLTVSAANAASGVLAALGFGTSTGSTAHLTIASLRLRNFELSLTPDTQVVGRGQGATFTLNSRTVSFTTPVTLSASPPTGSGITVNFASPTLVPGQSVNFTANSSASTVAASHSITINAQSGQVRESVTATLRVSDPDFEISLTPASQLVGPGNAVTFNVSIRPLIGFSQSVALSSSVSPNDGNLAVSFASTPVSAGGNTDMTVRAANSTPLNSTFTITVTGTSGSLTHTATASVTVSGPDFSLSFSPATLTAERGTVPRSLLNINRTGGFTGEVTLTPSDTSEFKVRVKPGGASTTDSSMSFKFKIKDGALLGAHDIIFTGRDSTGRQRTARITLIIQ